jgi:hypothetical protein
MELNLLVVMETVVKVVHNEIIDWLRNFKENLLFQDITIVVWKSADLAQFFFEFHPYSVRKKIEKKRFRDYVFGGFTDEINEIFSLDRLKV